MQLIEISDTKHGEPSCKLTIPEFLDWMEYQRDCLLTEHNLPPFGWGEDYPDEVVEEASVWRKGNPWFLRNLPLFLLETFVVSKLHQLSGGRLFSHQWETNESPEMYPTQVSVWCSRCGCNH